MAKRIISTFFAYDGRQKRSEIELLSAFTRRVRELDPSVEILITTDPNTAKGLSSIEGTLWIENIEQHQLLLDRCRTNLSILSAYKDCSQIIFSDYDIIYNILPIATNYENLSLTIRPVQKYPINGGIIVFSKPTNNSIDLYEQVLKRYAACPPEDLRWWGDQISLYEALSDNHEDLCALRQFEHSGLRVTPLPADKYNWTPFDMDVTPKTLWSHFFLTSSMCSEYNTKHCVHFKGPRKHLMMQYARSNYGLNPERLLGWRINDPKSQLDSLIAKLEKDLQLEPPGSSIWELADEIFGLLGILRVDIQILEREKARVVNILKQLHSKHQDFRFNLVFNAKYMTQSV